MESYGTRFKRPEYVKPAGFPCERQVRSPPRKIGLTLPPWEGPTLRHDFLLEVEMEFAISDMSCGGCASAITRAITSVDPAARLDIDVPLKIARITSTLTPQQLIQTIEAAGFHPSPRA